MSGGFGRLYRGETTFNFFGRRWWGFGVSIALMVWSVANTRCPVSAADSAAQTVSGSRISPIRISSGSWRRMCRSATAKV